MPSKLFLWGLATRAWKHDYLSIPDSIQMQLAFCVSAAICLTAGHFINIDASVSMYGYVCDLGGTGSVFSYLLITCLVLQVKVHLAGSS